MPCRRPLAIWAAASDIGVSEPLPVNGDRGGDEPLAEEIRLQAQAKGETMAKANPGEWIRQVQAEMRKVVWPTRQETVTTAIFVAIMMTLLSVFFLGIDSLFGALVNWLLKIA